MSCRYGRGDGNSAPPASRRVDFRGDFVPRLDAREHAQSFRVVGYPIPYCIIWRKECLQGAAIYAFGFDACGDHCLDRIGSPPFSAHQGWSRIC